MQPCKAAKLVLKNNTVPPQKGLKTVYYSNAHPGSSVGQLRVECSNLPIRQQHCFDGFCQLQAAASAIRHMHIPLLCSSESTERHHIE